MKVIPPVEINDLNLNAVSVAEPFTASAYSGATTYSFGNLVSESNYIYQSLVNSNNGHTPSLSPIYWEQVGIVETAYNAGTTYAANDFVYYQHRRYQSLQAANVGHTPYSSPTWWLDVGPTNQYAMFDTERATASVAASPITFTITPGQRINAIGFLGVVADSIRVQMTSNGASIYDLTTSLISRTGIINAYTYFFTQFTTSENLVTFDLPSVTNCVVLVTATRTQGNVEIGAVIVGTAIELGAAQHDGASDSMLNFSTIDNDVFGDPVLIKRRSLSEPKMTVIAPASLIDSLIATRELLNAVPALYCGVEQSDSYFFRALAVLGVFTQWDIGLPYASHCVQTFELKEI